MTSVLQVGHSVVEQTIATLRAAGKQRSERVVLWLGQRDGSCIEVEEMFHPKQESSVDYFRIPPAGMQAIMARLRARGTMIAAQVHSHPRDAFHSPADDRWAIVRHAGALSVVLPDFALNVTVENFLCISATYCLDPNNRWVHVPTQSLSGFIQIRT